MSARAFLDRLFANCTGGVVELRALPSKARAWAEAGRWAPLGPFVTSQVNAHQDVAVGVATRAHTGNGTASNLQELPAVFLDIDIEPARATRRLADFPFPASLVVSSGRGLHVYWLLKEPIDLRQPGEHARVVAILRRLATHLGGDSCATDATRVLRLPGSFNFKHNGARPVQLLETRDTSLNLSELDDHLPAEIVRHGQLIPENRLLEGRRNDVLYGVVRSLRYRGLPPGVIVRAVDVINATWCEPPLERPELYRLYSKALIQPDRPEFLARHRDDIVHDSATPDDDPDPTSPGPHPRRESPSGASIGPDGTVPDRYVPPRTVSGVVGLSLHRTVRDGVVPNEVGTVHVPVSYSATEPTPSRYPVPVRTYTYTVRTRGPPFVLPPSHANP